MDEHAKQQQAFPCQWDPAIYTEKGMTLRDYFAGQALAGMMAAGFKLHLDDEKLYRRACQHAYGIADAMLEMREE